MKEQEEVILVNNNDQEIGTMGKMESHMKGSLHRAISVFIFNSKNEMLLQRRSLNKYHTPGLWSNTACSHPRPKEKAIDAAIRRLFEEMRLKADLKFAFKFLYKVNFDNKLIEHELDHVFIGFTDEKPDYNTEEVCDWKYLNQHDLGKLLNKTPESFSPWFNLCYKRVFDKVNQLNIT